MENNFNDAIYNWLRKNNTSRFLAALVDMDGTLYNSMVNHAASWHRLMTKQGIPSTPDEFYLYEGMTGAQTIRRIWQREGRPAPSEQQISDLYHQKTLYFNELPLAEVMPGAQQVIDELKHHDLITVLVTGSGQPSVLARLDQDYPGIFPQDKRVTSRNVTHGKPHPEPYLKAMSLAGVQPSQSIVIENAPIGVQSGVAAGAFVIAVNTGPIPASMLKEAGAHVVFSDMHSLAEALKTIKQ